MEPMEGHFGYRRQVLEAFLCRIPLDSIAALLVGVRIVFALQMRTVMLKRLRMFSAASQL